MASKTTRTAACCRCNRSGICRGCACVNAGRPCSGCLPSQVGTCQNVSQPSSLAPKSVFCLPSPGSMSTNSTSPSPVPCPTGDPFLPFPALHTLLNLHLLGDRKVLRHDALALRVCSIYCYIVHSYLHLQEETFYHVGRLMAMCITQGGSGSQFCLYSNLSGTSLSTIVKKVPSYEVKRLIQQVY